jgi:hypothetical protein
MLRFARSSTGQLTRLTIQEVRATQINFPAPFPRSFMNTVKLPIYLSRVALYHDPLAGLPRPEPSSILGMAVSDKP